MVIWRLKQQKELQEFWESMKIPIIWFIVIILIGLLSILSFAQQDTTEQKLDSLIQVWDTKIKQADSFLDYGKGVRDGLMLAREAIKRKE